MVSGLAIKDVAERTGLAAGTIRMWEQRYGVPMPERTPGGYRMYSDERRRAAAPRARAARARPVGQRRAGARARRGRRRPTGPSIYGAIITGDAPTRPQVLRKRTLLAISRAIEDETLARAAGPVVFGAFQRERNYRAVQHRYGGWPRSPTPPWCSPTSPSRAIADGAPAEVPIEPDDSLGNEWAVVIDAPGLRRLPAGLGAPPLRARGCRDGRPRPPLRDAVDDGPARRAAGRAGRAARWPAGAAPGPRRADRADAGRPPARGRVARARAHGADQPRSSPTWRTERRQGLGTRSSARLISWPPIVKPDLGELARGLDARSSPARCRPAAPARFAASCSRRSSRRSPAPPRARDAGAGARAAAARPVRRRRTRPATRQRPRRRPSAGGRGAAACGARRRRSPARGSAAAAVGSAAVSAASVGSNVRGAAALRRAVAARGLRCGGGARLARGRLGAGAALAAARGLRAAGLARRRSRRRAACARPAWRRRCARRRRPPPSRPPRSARRCAGRRPCAGSRWRAACAPRRRTSRSACGRSPCRPPRARPPGARPRPDPGGALRRKPAEHAPAVLFAFAVFFLGLSTIGLRV